MAAAIRRVARGHQRKGTKRRVVVDFFLEYEPDLRTTEKELNFELEVEKQNYQTLMKKDRQGARRPQGDVLGSDKPQTVQLVRFYEDCTNLLVMGVKSQPGPYLGLDDWILGCMFTYVGENLPSNSKNSWVPILSFPPAFLNIFIGLSFNLTARWAKIDDDGSPVTSKDDLQEMIFYEPLLLDKMTPEFVNDLRHMGTSFSFTRDQLALFLRTLYNILDDVLNPEQTDEDEVEMVE